MELQLTSFVLFLSRESIPIICHSFSGRRTSTENPLGIMKNLLKFIVRAGRAEKYHPGWYFCPFTSYYTPTVRIYFFLVHHLHDVVHHRVSKKEATSAKTKDCETRREFVSESAKRKPGSVHKMERE